MKVKLSINNPIYVEEVKGVGEYSQLFLKYFDRIYALRPPEEITQYIPNSVYIYAPNVSRLKAFNYYIDIKISKKLEEQLNYNLFFDTNPHLKSISKIFKASVFEEKTIDIYVNDEYCGTYMPGYNILLASNWTYSYSEKQVAVVSKILSKLEEHSLKKITVPYSDEFYLGAEVDFELIDKQGTIYPCKKPYTEDGDVWNFDEFAVNLRFKAAASVDEFLNNVKSTLEKAKTIVSFIGTTGNVYPISAYLILKTKPAVAQMIVRAIDGLLHRFFYNKGGAWDNKPYYDIQIMREQTNCRILPSSVFLKPSITKIIAKSIFNLSKRWEVEYDPTHNGLEEFQDILGITENEYKELVNFREEYKHISHCPYDHWGV